MASVYAGTVFDEVMEFLASTPIPEQIIALQPSPTMQSRLSYLLEMNRKGVLSPEENNELEAFSQLEHFMRILKIKARQEQLLCD